MPGRLDPDWLARPGLARTMASWVQRRARFFSSGSGGAELSGRTTGKGIAAPGGQKKALPMAGPARESDLQSGLGRNAQRSSDALAQATAPAEGGADAEQGQGARDSSGGWVTKDHLNRLTGAGERPSADQA